MSFYLNKAILYGNLTRDPELRAMPSGMNVANFSIATNHTFKDKDGKKQEQTDFHNVVVFGRQADTVSQYLKKGSGVFIEGRMQTRSWDDKKTGEKKYRTEVVAERVQFGPRKQTQNDAATKEDDAWDKALSSEPSESIAPVEINPDDIPF